MDAKIKKGLLLFLLAVMSLPFLQHCLPFIQSGPLKGGFKDEDSVAFSLPMWMDGSYQYHKERYLNDKTGFRPDLVRLNNQLEFSLFDKCHAGWTVLGRDNMLFQRPYIDAYYGNDFVGYDTILEKSRKLKAIQDTLSRLGKSLIMAYAPSKATSYPEYFPEHLIQKRAGMTNFEAYRQVGDSMGINQVDMNTWFLAMKNKTQELIFSKQGIHWTSYGAIMAGDSLMRYIEKLRNIRVLRPKWDQSEHTTRPRLGDDDIGAELNLIFPVARETFAYPVIQDATDTTAKKPNVIYIGDSYGFKMVEHGIVNKMNNICERWSYFNQVVDVNGNKFFYMEQYDWHAAMARADCIVLLYTTFNLKELGSGFIEAAYDYYYPARR